MSERDTTEGPDALAAGMPEGWKDSIDVLKVRGFAPDGIPHDSDLYMVYEGLLIMKEMAEALEMAVEFCPVDCATGIKPDMIYGHKEARAALKKFKEWK